MINFSMIKRFLLINGDPTEVCLPAFAEVGAEKVNS